MQVARWSKVCQTKCITGFYRWPLRCWTFASLQMTMMPASFVYSAIAQAYFRSLTSCFGFELWPGGASFFRWQSCLLLLWHPAFQSLFVKRPTNLMDTMDY